MPFDPCFRSKPKRLARFDSLANRPVAGSTKLEMREVGAQEWVHIVSVSPETAEQELAWWREKNRGYEFRLT